MAHISAGLLTTRHEQRPVFLCNGRATSGSALHQRVASVSASFSKILNVRLGDRVALLAHTTDLFLESLLAATDAGATCCPLNWRWSAAEIKSALGAVGASLLLVDCNCWEMVASLDLAPSTHVVRLQPPTSQPGALAPGPEPAATLEQLATAFPDAQLQMLRPASDAAVICFTSGTTGTPKGVVLTHAAFHAQSLVKLALVQYCSTDVYLHLAPLFHIGGLSSALAVLMAGGRHVLLPKYSPGAVRQLLQQEGVTAFIAVPTMLQDLVDLTSRQAAATGQAPTYPSVLRLLVGAGGMPPSLQAAARATFPAAAITTAYGMSEACSSITFDLLHSPTPHPLHSLHARLPTLPASTLATASASSTSSASGSSTSSRPRGACVGWPAPGIALALDTEVSTSGSGCAGSRGAGGRCRLAEAEAGVVGEVLTRGPHVMAGYWGRPEETSQVLTADGWLRTGDLGYRDAWGRLWLVGRVKDMIKTGGENVYASEVEGVLAAHPAVKAAAVVGLPHARLGELVGALLVLQPGWRWQDGSAVGASSSSLPLPVTAVATSGSTASARATTVGSAGSSSSSTAKVVSQIGAALGQGSQGLDVARPSCMEQVVSLQGLQEHCRSRGLSAYKLPRFAAVSDAGQLPLNSSGKVVKPAVAAQLQAAAAAGAGGGRALGAVFQSKL